MGNEDYLSREFSPPWFFFGGEEEVESRKGLHAAVPGVRSLEKNAPLNIRSPYHTGTRRVVDGRGHTKPGKGDGDMIKHIKEVKKDKTPEV